MARKKTADKAVDVAVVVTGGEVTLPSESFQSIKQAQGRTAAMQYLKDKGVTWKEDEHEGINWMRACMAASKASM